MEKIVIVNKEGTVEEEYEIIKTTEKFIYGIDNEGKKIKVVKSSTFKYK